MRDAASKIIAGLKDALGFARCDHKWSSWKQRKDWPNQWWRVCEKCEHSVMRHSDAKPKD